MERNTGINHGSRKYLITPILMRWDKIHSNLICVFQTYIVQLRAPSNNQVALNASTCIGWPNGENVGPTELDQSDRKCTKVKPNGVR